MNEATGLDDSKLYVYGAGCTWHGPIAQAGNIVPSEADKKRFQDALKTTGLDVGSSLEQKLTEIPWLPCCPHCGGILYQLDSFERFMEGAIKLGPEYLAYLEWLQESGTCWGNPFDAAMRYTCATGKKVTLRNPGNGSKVRFSKFSVEIVEPPHTTTNPGNPRRG